MSAKDETTSIASNNTPEDPGNSTFAGQGNRAQFEQFCRSIISVDQVLYVLDEVETERRGNRDLSLKPIYEEIAERLVIRANETMEGTLFTEGAYTQAVQTLMGDQNILTGHAGQDEVGIVKTLTSKFILAAERAEAFITGESKSDFHRSEFLHFLDYEIQMLENVDEGNPSYSKLKLETAILALRKY